MEYNIEETIKSTIKKSDEAMLSALSNYQNEYYETCQNRLYYAIFYIVTALAYKDNFITSKHSQLMRWFNRKYIHENKIFDDKFFAIYKEAFENRQKSDYDYTYVPDRNEIALIIDDVKDFLSTVKQYLKDS